MEIKEKEYVHIFGVRLWKHYDHLTDEEYAIRQRQVEGIYFCIGATIGSAAPLNGIGLIALFVMIMFLARIGL